LADNKGGNDMSSTRFTWFDERPFRLQEELLRAFAPLLNAGVSRGAGVFPPVNIYDNGEAFLIRAELPGVRKDSLEVTAHANELTLKGERARPEVKGEVSYHRRETAEGSFSRTVTLPQQVDGGRISATYKAGVLEVLLPRMPEAQPRKITVH
jgi:HSP20 family protein